MDNDIFSNFNILWYGKHEDSKLVSVICTFSGYLNINYALSIMFKDRNTSRRKIDEIFRNSGICMFWKNMICIFSNHMLVLQNHLMATEFIFVEWKDG